MLLAHTLSAFPRNLNTYSPESFAYMYIPSMYIPESFAYMYIPSMYIPESCAYMYIPSNLSASAATTIPGSVGRLLHSKSQRL